MKEREFQEILNLDNNWFNFENAGIEKISERFLEPEHLSQKSFYKRASVIETENCFYLKSYDTIVCGVIKKTGEFFRYDWWTYVEKNYGIWGKYSEEVRWTATTGKHIREFTAQYHGEMLYKKEVLEYPDVMEY